MRIVSVDPASAKPLGVALLDEHGLVSAGLFSYKELYIFLDHMRPDMVVVEDQYMFKNYNTAKQLSWSTGKVMGICEVLGLPYQEMNVAHWKSVVKAQKGMHVQRCEEILGIQFQDDVASAILIGLCYLTENVSRGIIEVWKRNTAQNKCRNS